jgi:hypothetical protein
VENTHRQPTDRARAAFEYLEVIMRKVFIILAMLAASCSFASNTDAPVSGDINSLFPVLDGWTKDGSPEIFYADNLWEYINGAADVYLNYDFQKVATLTYDSSPKKSLTIDIYEHDTPRNAFGIYSQEKPAQGKFLKVGTQGYYDKGILNFYIGSYYIKLMGFYLGEEEQQFLESTAGELVGRLKGKPAVPKPVECFPDRGKISNSERYIAKDFLGRRILHSAFIADYELEGEKLRIFIIEAGDEAEAGSILTEYLKQVGEQGNPVTQEDGIYRFEDPYFESSGMMNIKSRDSYIWGLFSDNASVYSFYIEGIEKNLEKNQLID